MCNCNNPEMLLTHTLQNENPDIEQEFVQAAITQSMLETPQPDLRDGEISGSVMYVIVT